MSKVDIRIARLNRNESIDFDALPNASKDFVIVYGLKQLLNDSIVSGESDDERNGLLDKKLDKLLEGTLSIRDGGTRETDPVAVELTKLATTKTRAEFKGTKKPDPAAWAASMVKWRANTKLQAMAKRNAEELAEISIEL